MGGCAFAAAGRWMLCPEADEPDLLTARRGRFSRMAVVDSSTAGGSEPAGRRSCLPPCRPCLPAGKPVGRPRRVGVRVADVLAGGEGPARRTARTIREATSDTSEGTRAVRRFAVWLEAVSGLAERLRAMLRPLPRRTGHASQRDCYSTTGTPR
jgi:hypothetical protein